MRLGQRLLPVDLARPTSHTGLSMHASIAPAGSSAVPISEREAIRSETKRQIIFRYAAGEFGHHEAERLIRDLRLADA